MIDESHSSGFLGKTGRGTHEYRGVMGKIDIITGPWAKPWAALQVVLPAEEKK